jgi:hypothetical protein
MAGLVLGAMFLGFQAFYQPQVRHRIVEEQKEESIDDDSGDEPPGGRAFHEVLRRIRAGEEVDALPVRTDSPVHLDSPDACGLSDCGHFGPGDPQEPASGHEQEGEVRTPGIQRR